MIKSIRYTSFLKVLFTAFLFSFFIAESQAQELKKVSKNKKSKKYKKTKFKASRRAFSEAVQRSNPNSGKQLMPAGDGRTFRQRAKTNGSSSFVGNSKTLPFIKRKRSYKRTARKNLLHSTSIPIQPKRFQNYPNRSKFSPNKMKLYSNKQKLKFYGRQSSRMQNKIMRPGRVMSSRAIAIDQVRRVMLHRSRGVKTLSSKQKRNHYKKTSRYNLRHSGVPLKQWKKWETIGNSNYIPTVRKPSVRVFSKKQKKRYYSRLARQNANAIPSLRAINLSARNRNRKQLDRQRANAVGSIRVVDHKTKINNYRKISSETANFCSTYSLAADARRNAMIKLNQWSANYTGNIKALSKRDKEKMYRQFSKKYLQSKGNLKVNWLAYYWKRMIGKPDALRTSIKNTKPKRDKQEYKIWNY